MRRPGLLPIAIVLGIVTAATLLRTAETLSEPRIDGWDAERSKAVAHEFYAALNDAIRDDDSAALARVASPDLVVHRTAGAVSMGRADFLEEIADLHGTYPYLRAEVADLVAEQDRVFARIRLVSDAEMDPLGLPTTIEPSARFTDSLRVRDGRVVEYAGRVTDLAVPQLVMRETFDAGNAETAPVALARLTLNPGAGFPTLISPGPTVYAVESGSITMQIDGAASITRGKSSRAQTASPSAGAGSAEFLGPGDQIAIPAGTTYDLYATKAGPAVVFALTLMTPNALLTPAVDGDGPPAEPAPAVRMYLADALAVPSMLWPDGVASQPLVGAISAPLPPSPFDAAVWQLTLDADAVFHERPTNGRRLVAVLAGLAITTSGEDHDRTASVMTAGSSLILDSDTAVAIRNAGDTPLVLLVLSFASSEGPATLSFPSVEVGQGCAVGDPCRKYP